MIMQPFLDLFTSLTVRFGHAITIGIIVRSIFMLFAFLYILSSSKQHKKKVFIIYFVILLLYFVLYTMLFLLHTNTHVALQNFYGLIKTFYICFVFIAGYLIYKDYGLLISYKTICIVIDLYMSIIFLAFITNSSFPSYQYGYGYNGWFYSANEIGTIFCILSPLAAYVSISKLSQNSLPFLKKILFVLPLLLIDFCASYIGTKVPFLGIISFLVIYSIYNLISYLHFQNKLPLRKFVITLLTILIAICFMYQSPLQKNVVMNYQNNQKQITSISDYTQTQKSNVYNSEKAKENTLENNFVNNITSNRINYMLPAKMEFMKSGILTKLFGLGYVDYFGTNNSIGKAIELDLACIFYRHGIIGFTLFSIPILGALFAIIICFFKNISVIVLSDKACTYFYSLLLSFCVALVSGHTLVAPAVSIYVAILLVQNIAYMFSHKKENAISEKM